MNVCPEIKIVLDAYSKALDKAKSEAGLTEGRDRASQVAIRKFLYPYVIRPYLECSNK